MDTEQTLSSSALVSAKAPHSPKVSIGMPVYNGEPFIREALDSLLAQTFTDFELIISDNASTDGTEAICREYAAKDARIQYVRQAANRGSTANFQFVLDEALGEYFMWAAADDEWLPKFIETTVNCLQTDESASMAMTGYRCVSRFSPLFNRRFPSILSCIENKDAKLRVPAYAKQPFSTHKDNLVYALWRRCFIKEITASLAGIFHGETKIGGAMNEYALLKGYGCYAGQTLFLKRYRYVPPGHWAEPLTDYAARMLKTITGNKRSSSSSSTYSDAEFIADLENMLVSTDVELDLANQIIAANKLHLQARL